MVQRGGGEKGLSSPCAPSLTVPNPIKQYTMCSCGCVYPPSGTYSKFMATRRQGGGFAFLQLTAVIGVCCRHFVIPTERRSRLLVIVSTNLIVKTHATCSLFVMNVLSCSQATNANFREQRRRGWRRGTAGTKVSNPFVRDAEVQRENTHEGPLSLCTLLFLYILLHTTSR